MLNYALTDQVVFKAKLSAGILFFVGTYIFFHQHEHCPFPHIGQMQLSVIIQCASVSVEYQTLIICRFAYLLICKKIVVVILEHCVIGPLFFHGCSCAGAEYWIWKSVLCAMDFFFQIHLSVKLCKIIHFCLCTQFHDFARMECTHSKLKYTSAIVNKSVIFNFSGDLKPRRSCEPDCKAREQINFISGNPFVEVTKGILHLYKEE